MACDVEKVDVNLVPEGKIVYNSESRQFQYLGDRDDWFQAVVEVDVTANGITDSAIFFAYTTADEDQRVVRAAGKSEQHSGAFQYVRDRN